MTNGPQYVIKFPCDFTLKVMGEAQGDFEAVTLAVVKKHFPKTDLAEIQKNSSKQGKYLALSITVNAESKMQLDALYQELSSTKEILMVL
ncbi:MAG: hypothetical protein A3E82_08920 [Gammaproteobacteria bacterium RIFCSPHIGHO2_12_FULL_38_11]|nr:MAG: hypothetical protein A3E82_08920 [Gammaproteobacteria bacterium RIFCSPHIGHO2_12_FULL_38_11]